MSALLLHSTFSHAYFYYPISSSLSLSFLNTPDTACFFVVSFFFLLLLVDERSVMASLQQPSNAVDFLYLWPLELSRSEALRMPFLLLFR